MLDTTGWELLQLIVRRVPFALVPTHLGGWLFWLVMILVWVQYRRVASMERQIYGYVHHSAVSSTLSATGFGLLAGIVGSWLLLYFGITLSQSDILYLWPVALFLFLVSPRLLCFSYAGGMVALSHLLLGWPANVNVPSVMALVAVLHLMEGVLVAVSGAAVATPVYLRNRGGHVVGGFLMQRFWPIPIMLVFLTQLPEEFLGPAMAMPDWWPLIGAAPQVGEGWALVITTVVAALGYSDLALTQFPRQRARMTSLWLLAFSVLLFAFSWGASQWAPMLWVAALFAPVGHELMIHWGNRNQLNRSPRFVPSVEGVSVLAVKAQGHAEGLGVSPGDVILSVNDVPVTSRMQLQTHVLESSFYLGLVVRDEMGDVRLLETNRYPRHESLDVITVPEPGDRPHVDLQADGLLMRFWKRLRHRFRR